MRVGGGESWRRWRVRGGGESGARGRVRIGGGGVRVGGVRSESGRRRRARGGGESGARGRSPARRPGREGGGARKLLCSLSGGATRGEEAEPRSGGRSKREAQPQHR
ncbi:hypothetical protein PVAP13_9KG268913 [Panicum virgatum]|uniref:Uncharacterized protein n=1 Tax=Panicum virgatum TaxID=38727 RepID=A0A8T0NM31_PANVG|nr:hypothetical protein PVAP13_9KG268913 [Panicum virgatum]